MDYFHIRNIDDVLSTGGAPTTAKQIDELKKAGISTIVSLEPLSPSLARIARADGLKVVNLPVGWFKEVPLDTLKRFISLAALAEANQKRIFLHCLHGRDRTGEVTAAYILAKKSFERAKELGLMGPIRLVNYKTQLQTHFERTLQRAKKFGSKPR